MAYFLFVDESGHDRRESPCEVLAGVAVEDRDLWNLVCALQDAELRHFGRRYSGGGSELKAKKLLNRKVYRLAGQMAAFPAGERTQLASRCLEDGAGAGRRELTALAQAKLAYVQEVLRICAAHRCRVFASIINPASPRPESRDHLRKDYVYLFERFCYFLEDTSAGAMGVVVFDELEKTQSHLLVGQMDRYFKSTATGRMRSTRIIPEPFFVHSDLTTGIQIADLVAYLVSWGFRTPGMSQPAREEMAPLVERMCQMRHRALRDRMGKPQFVIWSFAVIDDLRARGERLPEAGEAG